MRSEYDANRALAARRLGHGERCLRPRPLLERMAARERAERNELRTVAAGVVAMLLGVVVVFGILIAGSL